MHRIWLVIAAASIVPAILDALQTYAQARLTGTAARWQDLVFQGAEWLFLGGLTPITYYLGRRFPLQRGRWVRSLAVHLGGAATLCVGWASLGVLLGHALDRYPAGNYLNWLLTSVPWSVFMYFTVLGCVYAFTYFVEAREREAQASRLSAQLAEARLSALQMQIHPHFLFNTLNAIAVLVREQQATAATRMLEQLGDMLHQVLDADRGHEVALADDLRFVEQYLAIEQVRFSDRLRVEWSIDEAARHALVPAFLLQPLVENAIRHGIMRRSGAGRVSIGARLAGPTLELIVEDDGVGMPPEQVDGVGLTNTRARLDALYGDRASVRIERSAEGGTRVVITLPQHDTPEAR